MLIKGHTNKSKGDKLLKKTFILMYLILCAKAGKQEQTAIFQISLTAGIKAILRAI